MGQILRFCIVGTAVAGLYFGGVLLALELGLGGATANILSLSVAVAVQYVAQTAWTFRRPLAVPEQILRFACTIGFGFVTSTLITVLLGPGLGWSAGLAAVVVMVWLPVQNYVIFRIWVYAAPET